MSIISTLSKTVNDVVDTVTDVQNTIRTSVGDNVKNLLGEDKVGDVVDNLVEMGNSISTNVGETIKKVSSLVGEQGDTLITKATGEIESHDDNEE